MAHLDPTPSVSTDQIAAFVELARCGSLRLAASALHITEQGVRNRLLALENRLGVELYRKCRGPRRATPLTPRGAAFLSHATSFLQRAQELGEVFQSSRPPKEIHVAASQYLLMYILIDAVRRFHAAQPHVRVRLSTHNERDIEQVLLADPQVAMGIAAPYEPSSALHYHHMFSMNWSLLTPRRHPLNWKQKVRLSDLRDAPLILFERGSAGRQHVLEAFQERGIDPRVSMETTTTEIIVRMVEAGLGVAIVPLLSGGVVTRGRKVVVVPIADAIRPIRSGILTRKGEALSPAAEEFVAFVREAQ